VHITIKGDTYETDLSANPKSFPPAAITDITEEYVKAALEAYPEVHPGWKNAFARAAEIMEKRRAAKAAREGQEIPPAPCSVEVPAEAST